jgi:cytochrome bd-type quinol oxidase subunit 2
VQVDEAHGDPEPPDAELSAAMLARPARKREHVVNIGSEGTLLIFAVYVILVAMTALLARRKGRSAALWAVVALFLPLIALVIVLLLPAKAAPEGGRSA